MKRYMTAIIEKEGNGYVALCPELDIASQGETVSDAKKIPESTITVPVPDHPEIRIGTLQSIIRQSGLTRKEFK
ncbi:MAG: hypothetical protein A2277_11695 [Desulfobacterales bacterium RIFOXYA12_FULL_46_15]|nr:MAG: hypothetical protein A2277_11695 [Desulfobacterales bacterium RIFOXYA12_FULL_46_15]